MRQSLGIARIVAVSDPRGRFLRVTCANAVFRLHVLPASVRLEVDADQRLGADGAAQVHELRGPNLVRFDSTPEQVEHRRTLVAWSDAFTPAIEVHENAAPSHHRRREIARHGEYVLAPA